MENTPTVVTESNTIYNIAEIDGHYIAYHSTPMNNVEWEIMNYANRIDELIEFIGILKKNY